MNLKAREKESQRTAGHAPQHERQVIVSGEAFAAIHSPTRVSYCDTVYA